jgi:hypothetical protein
MAMTKYKTKFTMSPEARKDRRACRDAWKRLAEMNRPSEIASLLFGFPF